MGRAPGRGPGAGDEAAAREHVTELVGLAPAQNPVAAARRERGDHGAEHRPERADPGCVRDERHRQDGRTDHVREARRTRILELPLTEIRLHELEVRETRKQ